MSCSYVTQANFHVIMINVNDFHCAVVQSNQKASEIYDRKNYIKNRKRMDIGFDLLSMLRSEMSITIFPFLCLSSNVKFNLFKYREVLRCGRLKPLGMLGHMSHH